MRYVIVGNSAAAVAAVAAIRTVDAGAQVTMCSPEEGCAYGTPLISYVLEGETTIERAVIRDESWYAANNVTCEFGPGKGAVALDASAKVVTLEDGTELAYDKVLFACGSTPTPPRGIEGLSEEAPYAPDVANSFAFNTMGDTRAILDYLSGPEIAAKRASGEPVSVVISGSGLIGAKAAEGICHHVDVTYLVGHAKRVLRKLLDDEASPVLAELMGRHGIENVAGTVVTGVAYDESSGAAGGSDGGSGAAGSGADGASGSDGGSGADGAAGSDGGSGGRRIASVTLDDGRELDCDLLITAIGVRPNVSVLSDAGAEVSRGVVCDGHMLTSLPDVYAAGDVANTANVLTGEDVPLALWPTASEQGRVAGLNMAGAEATFDGSFARNAVGFFGELNIVGCGIINPAPDDPDIESVVSWAGDDGAAGGAAATGVQGAGGAAAGTQAAGGAVATSAPAATAAELAYSKFNIRDGKLVGYLLMNRPEAAGIYTLIIKNQIPLADLPDDIFERAPRMLDLPAGLRSRNMLKGRITSEAPSGAPVFDKWGADTVGGTAAEGGALGGDAAAGAESVGTARAGVRVAEGRQS